MEDLKTYHVEVTDSDRGEKELKPVICAVCDSIAKCPNWADWVNIDNEFTELCRKSNLGKKRLENIYEKEVLEYYTAPHQDLEPYILSPYSIIEDENILVCKDCCSHMQKEASKKRTTIKNRKPPREAIANGYLIGEAPEELKCLNEVELSLVSKVRIHSRIWVYFAGCHKQIQGWHTFYKNRPTSNISNIQTVQDAGLQGNIMVILCGPFTTTQKTIAMEATRVRPEKVMAAFEWLVENNCHYTVDDIPDPNDFPKVELITEHM
jgi:hypothetical protein